MKTPAKFVLLSSAAAAAAAVVVLSLGCCRSQAPEPAAAGAHARAWAEPVKLAGVGNCFKVSGSLYRGEQPTPEGFVELGRLGVKTVVNLRAFHSDADEIKESGVAGLEAVHIYFKTWHAEDEDVIKFLKTAADPAKAPVFVHCMHGSDRTGLMCAIYRVAVQGWGKDEALEEMTKGPYGFHSVWKNLPTYFKELDVARIRREAGITVP